jgi:chromate transporter
VVYVRYGSTPQGNDIFYGIKPVIIAVILQALYFLGSKAVREPVTILTGVAVAAAYLFGVNEIALLFGGGLFVMLWKNAGRLRGGNLAAFILPLTGIDTAAAEAKGATLASIFLVFLKIGSVLYGSGYVLLAFLNSDFVEHRGWLTHQQLLDIGDRADYPGAVVHHSDGDRLSAGGRSGCGPCDARNIPAVFYFRRGEQPHNTQAEEVALGGCGA